MKAIWNNTVVAESDNTIVIEGNHYFPPSSVESEYLVNSTTNTRCGWKGIASYYSIKVNGKINKDAAWYYREPLEAAKQIKNYVAFWNGVKVTQ